uniref:Si:dkey-73n10.1 n=1 Tax=Cynoglossus semilaevis TaxID=244447 RepID=A0A3P8V746_CYNSE
MEGQNHIFYRQDASSEKKQPHSSPPCHVPVKQGFTLYTKSPVVSTTTAATSVTVREQSSRGENPTPPPENSLYFAVHKPLYGPNLCCNELGCMMGHRYIVERGSPRPTKTVYQPEWIPTDAHYTDRPPLLRKAADAALQQRPSAYELGAKPPKRITTEKHSPRPTMTLPAGIDPNYSSYPCTPTRTLFGTLSEQSQLLNTPPRSYPGLYSSHPTYEHLTSEVYQEHSSMSKYGHLTQYPVFYYPQANEEPQKSTQCKNLGSKQREDIPVILKHAVPVPQEHYIVPQSFHGEIPLPRTETLPSHSLMHGFDYPCYLVPRIHLNADQVRMPLMRPSAPPGFHSNGINVSSSSQERLQPRASLQKDKDNPSPHVDQARQSLPFLCRDPTSPTKYSNQHQMVSTHNMKCFPSISSLLTDTHLRPAGDLSVNRVRDPSSCESHLPWVKQPTCLPVPPAAWMPLSPSHHTAGSNSANVQRIIYCPPLLQGNGHNSPRFSSGCSVIKGSMKRSFSSSPTDIKIKKEKRDCCETEPITKGQKLEDHPLKVEMKPVNPLMPVIDSVFSLAPYQTNTCPNRVSRKTEHSPEQFEAKPDMRHKMSNEGEQRTVISTVCNSDAAAERPEVEGPEHRKIKVEKMEPQGPDNTPEETPALPQDFTKLATATAEAQTTTRTSESNVRIALPQSTPPSTCKILLQDTKPPSLTPPPDKSPTATSTPKPEPQMPVRKHFLELHHSLCKLISKSVFASSEQELRAWLSQLHLTEPSSQSTKVQKYTSQKRCPFPHVMRAGAIFLPMLVIKELLFPTVQSSFIDQVLHEHKVELRPTTLSEEKILIQLHKRACSSRLRRLMSLKHLPDIYADVVNLLYYACVCKHLGEFVFTLLPTVQRERRATTATSTGCQAKRATGGRGLESSPKPYDPSNPPLKANTDPCRRSNTVPTCLRATVLNTGVAGCYVPLFTRLGGQLGSTTQTWWVRGSAIFTRRTTSLKCGTVDRYYVSTRPIPTHSKLFLKSSTTVNQNGSTTLSC